MSKHAIVQLPKLCLRCSCTVPIASTSRLLSTSAVAKRQEGNARSARSGIARAPARGRPAFRSNGERSAFKLSPNLPAAPPSKSEVLEDLRSKVQALSTPGRGSMGQIVAALATRLGLDIVELQGFASTWAKTDPFDKSHNLARSSLSDGCVCRM